MHQFELVILESPFKPKVGDNFASEGERQAALARELDYNVRYARAAMRDCLKNFGEAPSASHLLYTQEGVLDDNDDAERALGIEAGLAFRAATTKSVVYLDRGISTGMIYGIKAAQKDGKKIVCRRLPASVLESLGIPTVEADPSVLASLGIDLDQAMAA